MQSFVQLVLTFWKVAIIVFGFPHLVDYRRVGTPIASCTTSVMSNALLVRYVLARDIENEQMA